MANKRYLSIVDRLLNGKTNAKELAIRARKSAVSLGSGRLFVGRTPGRFVDIKGHEATKDLSIQEALDILGANQAARRIFPLAATPGGHWIYFALFSTCRQTPGLNPLRQYIKVLSYNLDRQNAGVARRLLDKKRITKRQIKTAVDRYKRVHDIRLRIPDEADRRVVIQKDVMPRLHALVMSNRWNRSTYKTYKKLARAVRAAWCRQSPILRKHGNDTLVKSDKPSNLQDIDLVRVYAGYWLIRSLYGIEIENNSDEVRRNDNVDLIRKSTKNALRYLGMLKGRTGQSYENIFRLLEDARCTKRPSIAGISSGIKKPAFCFSRISRTPGARRRWQPLARTRAWSTCWSACHSCRGATPPAAGWC